jgi:hypothetical protein
MKNLERRTKKRFENPSGGAFAAKNSFHRDDGATTKQFAPAQK